MKKIFKIVFCAVLSSMMLGCAGNENSDGEKAIDRTQTESVSEDSDSESEDSSEETDSSENSSEETQTETEAETELKNEEPKTEEETEQKDFKEAVPVSTNGLSNKKIGWYFGANDTHDTPSSPREADYLDKYDAYYVGDTSQKAIYLTFDEGYENGYSSKILDVLKEKDVKAAFFVTKSYIASNQELIKRMVDEGHVVGNHSVRHLSSPDLSDDELKNELTETADYFKEVTGQEMPHVFRPPMGEFSERTLAVTQSLGYKTIFWSFAYRDWLVDEQPGKQAAYDKIMAHYHNGAIPLLHAVSQSNTEALGDVIDSLREKGYTFASLEDL